MNHDTHCEFINHGLYYSYNSDIRHCCIQERVDKKFDISSFESNPQQFLDSDPDLSAITRDIDSGIKNPYCQKCWYNESAGIASQRHYSTNMIRPLRKDRVIEYIDLRLGNKCNLKCKMCFPTWSNQIHSHFLSAKENGIINSLNSNLGPELYSEESHQKYLERVLTVILNTPTIKTVALAGGEPFVMPEVEWFLTELINQRRTNIRLRILTNVTVVTDKLLTLLKKFEFVSIHCSIDGVEEDIEYQRFPCKWSVIENNFDKLYYSGLRTVLVPCFSQLNTLSVLKFLTWAGKYTNTSVFFNEVTDPSFLNFQLIPMEYRQELISEIEGFVLPANIDKNFKIFFDKIKNNVKQITVEEKEQLRAAVDLWDFRSRIKYREKYPWADFLLNYEQ